MDSYRFWVADHKSEWFKTRTFRPAASGISRRPCQKSLTTSLPPPSYTVTLGRTKLLCEVLLKYVVVCCKFSQHVRVSRPEWPMLCSSSRFCDFLSVYNTWHQHCWTVGDAMTWWGRLLAVIHTRKRGVRSARGLRSCILYVYLRNNRCSRTPLSRRSKLFRHFDVGNRRQITTRRCGGHY